MSGIPGRVAALAAMFGGQVGANAPKIVSTAASSVIPPLVPHAAAAAVAFAPAVVATPLPSPRVEELAQVIEAATELPESAPRGGNEKGDLIRAILGRKYTTAAGKESVRALLANVIAEEKSRGKDLSLLYLPLNLPLEEGKRVMAYFEYRERIDELISRFTSENEKEYRENLDSLRGALSKAIVKMLKEEYSKPVECGGGGDCMFYSAIRSGRLEMDHVSLRAKMADALPDMLIENEIAGIIVTQRIEEYTQGIAFESLTEAQKQLFALCGAQVPGEENLVVAYHRAKETNSALLKELFFHQVNWVENHRANLVSLNGRVFLKKPNASSEQREFQFNCLRRYPAAPSFAAALAQFRAECGGDDFRMYAEHMRTPTIFTGDTELMALGRALGRPIIVHEASGDQVVVYNINAEKPHESIVIHNTGRAHYQALEYNGVW